MLDVSYHDEVSKTLTLPGPASSKESLVASALGTIPFSLSAFAYASAIDFMVSSPDVGV